MKELYNKKQIKISINNLMIELRSTNDVRRKSLICKNIGDSYIKSGKIQEAIEYYFKALDLIKKINGNSIKDQISTLYYYIGKSYSYNNDYLNEKKYYLKALKFEKSIDDYVIRILLYINIGHNLKNLGKYREAIKSYNKVLKIDKADSEMKADALLYMSICSSELEEYDTAVELINKALSFEGIPDENKSDYYKELGVAYRNLKKKKEAFESFEEGFLISDINPDDWIYSFFFAEVAWDLRKYLTVKKHLEKIIDYLPTENGDYFENTYYWLGYSYMYVKEYKKALKIFDKAMKLKFGKFKIEDLFVIGIADTYFEMADFRKAIKYCKKALLFKETIDNPDRVYYVLAYSNFELSNIKKAKIYTDKLRENNPEYNELRTLIEKWGDYLDKDYQKILSGKINE